MLVFALAQKLGGRKEVLSAPIVESLGHLLLLRKENEALHEKETWQRWLQYLMLVNSHPMSKDAPSDDKKKREEFVESIRPQMKALPAKKFDWDVSQMERIKAMQGGE